MPNLRKDKLDFRQNHAIVIGIDHYPLIQNPLTSAVNDASRIAQLLKNNQGFDNVLVLLEANMPDLMALINWLGSKKKEDSNPLSIASFQNPEASIEKDFTSKSTIGWYEGAKWTSESGGALPLVDFREKDWSIDPDKDSILFYYAGHGIKGDPDNGPAGYVVPADAAGGIGDYRNLIPMDDLYKSLRTLGCLHTLLILDCCFAGKFRFSHSTRFMAGTEVPHLYKERFLQYTRSRAWQVLASSGPDQEANDSFSLLGVRSDNSPFAASLIEALQGEADLQQEGVITAVELYLSVRQKVKKLQEQQEGGGKPQHPGLFPMEDHRGGEFIFLNPNFDFDTLKERPLQNPYKGLLPYEPEDGEWFFGREKELEEAVRRIENLPLLIISGDSAVGKSSFARAGLYAYLKKELDFELLSLRPGSKPWKGQSVITKRKMRDGSEEVEKHFTGLEELLKSVSGEEEDLIQGFMGPNTQNRMILIDQYEEIFTECKDPEELKKFEEELQKLIIMATRRLLRQTEQGTTRIVMTLRSDFEWQLETSALGQSLLGENRDGYYNLVRLLPLGLDELRDALTGPASKEIFEFEEGLVEQILEDINYAPAALPLLSFTMKKLYEATMEKGEKDGNGDPKRFFTKHLYADPKEGIGGVVGALRTSANQLYLSLGKKLDGEVDESIETPLQETMKKVILRLIRPGEGQATRRRVYHSVGRLKDFWSELDYPQDEDDQMVEEVLDRLEEAQLIVRGKDMGNRQSYIELAHDALVNNWPRSLQWIKDFGQDRLVLLRQLWEVALENKKKSLPAGRKKDPYKKEKFVAASNRSAVIQTSSLWDNSPKLMEVIHLLWDPDCQISQGENKDILEATANFLENELKEEERTSTKTFLTQWIADHQILIGSSFEKLEALDFKAPAEVLQLVLFEGRHWLNQLEADFVWESWNKRRSRIAHLIKERDEAKANFAKIYARTALQQKEKGDFEGGMRLAMKAWQIAPSPRPALVYEAFTHKSEEKGDAYYLLYSHFEEKLPKLTYLNFSPDGQRIIALYENHNLKVWDFDGAPVFDLDKFSKRIEYARLSDRGDLLVTGSRDRHLQVWDLKSKVPLVEKYMFYEPFINFSPDGKQIILIHNYNSIQILDPEREVEPSLDTGDELINYAQLFPKGDYLMTLSKEDVLKIWDLNGQEKANFGKHTMVLKDPPPFSPDGERVVTNNKGLIKLWDLKGSAVVLEREFNMAHNPKFSPKGDYVVTSTADPTDKPDHTVKIWDRAGKLVHFYKHSGRVSYVEFDMDGKKMLSISEDEEVKICDLASKQVTSLLFKDKSHRIISAEFFPDGKRILTCSSDYTRIWNLEGRIIDEIDKYTEGYIGRARFSPDGQFVLTFSKPFSSYASIIKVWELKDEVIKKTKIGSFFDLSGAKFSPKGGVFMTLSSGRVEWWDIKGNKLRHFNEPKIQCAGFSPSGDWFVFCTGNAVKLLEIEKNKLITLEGHEGVLTAKFSPDEQWLLTLSESAVNIWEFKKNMPGPIKIETDERHIANADFSPKQNYILIFPRYKNVQFWNIKGESIDILNGQEEKIDNAAFSRDEELIATTSKRKIKLWDRKGALVATLNNHRSEVVAVQFSPKADKLLSCSADNVILWDRKGNLLVTLEGYDDGVSYAHFSSDGQFIFTYSKNGNSGKVWDTEGHLIIKLDDADTIDYSPHDKTLLAFYGSKFSLWPMPGAIQDWVGEFDLIPFTKKEKERYRL